MKDLMLDLETLGIRPTSVIVQIGACYFDRYTGKIGNTFLINIDTGSNLLAGLTIDQSTIDWWKEQPNKTWLVGKILGIHTALSSFEVFAKDATAVWSHATFDVPILANAYTACNKKLPFHFRAARDIRTLVDLSDVKFSKESEAEIKTHNALEDCVRQVKYCVECFNKLKSN